MGVVDYYCVNGEILGDSEAGDYMRDALGSVIATCSPTTGAVQNTYRYKPYGARLAKTGFDPDPRFQHVGIAGYRDVSISHSANYVRRRHQGKEEGRWTTIDPLWPLELEFQAFASNPVNNVDPTGYLAAKAVTPWILGRCGYSESAVLFTDRPKVEGYVVQHVILKSKVSDCGDPPTSLNKPWDSYDLWELFCYKKVRANLCSFQETA